MGNKLFDGKFHGETELSYLGKPRGAILHIDNRWKYHAGIRSYNGVLMEKPCLT